jgi:hypothetical protein
MSSYLSAAESTLQEAAMGGSSDSHFESEKRFKKRSANGGKAPSPQGCPRIFGRALPEDVDSQAHGAANFGSSPETEFFNSILDFRIFLVWGRSGILRTKIWGDSEVDVEVAGDLESCRWL